MTKQQRVYKDLQPYIGRVIAADLISEIRDTVLATLKIRTDPIRDCETCGHARPYPVYCAEPIHKQTGAATCGDHECWIPKKKRKRRGNRT